MQNKRNLKLIEKIVLASVPVIVGVTFAIYKVYTDISSEDARLMLAVNLVEKVNYAELQMVKMSESLRGFLIDPSQLSEAEKKEVADAEYGKTAEELGILLKGYPEVRQLNEVMAQFDESTLDKIEDEVVEIAKEKPSEGRKMYQEKYVPARLKQNENFKRLKSMVAQISKQLTDGVNEEIRSDGWTVIYTLISSTALGLLIFFGITFTLHRNLLDSTKTLRESSDFISNVSAEIHEASVSLSTQGQTQTQAIEEISSSIHEVVNTLKNTLTHSKGSVDHTRAIEKMVDAGNNTIREAHRAMDELALSNARFESLAKLIEQIGEKTNLIDDIVFQTRLLSFNASVEAERAGEHGRGFAVVAQEVGNLAQMSGKSAYEIADIVKRSIQEAREAVEFNRQKIELSLKYFKDAVKTFEEIQAATGKISQGSDQIYRSSEEQSSAMEQISQSAESINSVSQQNAVLADQTLKSVSSLRDQTHKLDEILRAFDRLVHGQVHNVSKT